jgi:hypothetical protein
VGFNIRRIKESARKNAWNKMENKRGSKSTRSKYDKGKIMGRGDYKNSG